jgi:RNA polymerase sigma-70 factor (ECF subfamily)
LELVAAVLRGEGWAAQEVWDRHASSVRRFLARALGPKADVDDLTQETFMRVFSRMDGLRDAGALREFVLAVAVNVLRRELRRRWVRRRVLLSHDGSVPEMEGPTADPEARQALARCYSILDRLGSRERAAFALRYMEERTLEDVAQVLGVSLSTAKRLVNKSTAYVDKHVGNDEGLRTFFDRRRRSVAGSRSGQPSDANNSESKKAKSNVRG